MYKLYILLIYYRLNYNYKLLIYFFFGNTNIKYSLFANSNNNFCMYNCK